VQNSSNTCSSNKDSIGYRKDSSEEITVGFYLRYMFTVLYH